jgi:hypothetical protein
VIAPVPAVKPKVSAAVLVIVPLKPMAAPAAELFVVLTVVLPARAVVPMTLNEPPAVK